MAEIRRGQRLVFKDGSTIENARAGMNAGFLWCYAPPMTMAEAASVFLDTSKTDRIIFQYGEMEDTYEGYTKCIIMRSTEEDGTSICLVQENA